MTLNSLILLNYHLHSRLALALKKRRKFFNKTQQHVAVETGLSRLTIMNCENGKGSLASFNLLSDVLECKIVGRSLPSGDSLGESLKILRKRQKLSLRKLSELTELSVPTIMNVEGNGSVYLYSIEKIADVLGAGLCLLPNDQSLSFYNSAANSSNFQAWTTPPDILEKLYPIVGGIFDLDPCSPTSQRKTAPVKAKTYYTGQDDDNGLSLPWHGSVFVNPPYGRELKLWIKKCHDESQSGRVKVCIALIPARPDTAAWHRYIAQQADVIMLRGRLRFGGQNGEAAPFPSALVVWNANDKDRDELKKAFSDSWHIFLN